MWDMIGIGLMSGTSMDGVDAALAGFRQRGPAVQVQVRDTLHVPYPPPIIEAISRVQTAEVTMECIAELDAGLGRFYAEVAAELLRNAPGDAAVDFVASHGQTVFHRPPGQGTHGVSFQIGNPAWIAEATHVKVVSDFRSADMAAGGHGAPLVPAADYYLFADPTENRAVQNIGGIANVTFLPRGGSLLDTRAFDSGPGNMLIDGVVKRVTGGRLAFDPQGSMARDGNVDSGLLHRLLEHPYYAQTPPKSTGRETFGDAYVSWIWSQWHGRGEDLIATVTAATATTIAIGYRRFLPALDRVIVGGGGVHNRTLMEHLARELGPVPVDRTDAFGVPVTAREALAFALLGYLTLTYRPGNVPLATGASHPAILGRITLPVGR